jgi:hypothetical protein
MQACRHAGTQCSGGQPNARCRQPPGICGWLSASTGSINLHSIANTKHNVASRRSNIECSHPASRTIPLPASRFPTDLKHIALVDLAQITRRGHSTTKRGNSSLLSIVRHSKSAYVEKILCPTAPHNARTGRHFVWLVCKSPSTDDLTALFE